MNAVRAEDLRKSFAGPDGGKVKALDGVSMGVRRGTLTALVGPDGAGKTSLLRILTGLLAPDAGTAMVLGTDVVADPQAVQDRISYMPQRFGLYEDLGVQENLDLYADLHGVPMEERRATFARMLQMTDLAAFTGRPAGKLSGGMKQKLGLACTLVRSPDLLILDEPTVGVDPLSRRDLWKIIQHLVEEDRLSVLVSTAYMDEAERCEEVLVLHEGRLLATGTPGDLRAIARGRTFTAAVPDGTPARQLQARLIDAPEQIVDAVPRGGNVAFIRQENVPEEALTAIAGDIEPRPETLEDAFMILLRDQERAQPAPPPLPQAAPARNAGQTGRRGEPAIIVRDLVKKFGDFTAVARTSFEVSQGEIFGLLGPNGAGKTTTFRMLCGLLPATSGHLQVAGVDLRTARAEARRRIGYVAQKFSLYGNLTVRENLEFFGGAYGLFGKALGARIDEMLEQFELDPSSRAALLPAGFKQRLAMATGLLHQPEILFLDEPTSGIDPLARRAFWRTITDLAIAGVTIVVTTHFMEEAEYCDRIAIQDAGEMLALGTPREVRRMAGNRTDMDDAFIAIVEAGRARRGQRSAA